MKAVVSKSVFSPAKSVAAFAPQRTRSKLIKFTVAISGEPWGTALGRSKAAPALVGVRVFPTQYGLSKAYWDRGNWWYNITAMFLPGVGGIDDATGVAVVGELWFSAPALTVGVIAHECSHAILQMCRTNNWRVDQPALVRNTPGQNARVTEERERRQGVQMEGEEHAAYRIGELTNGVLRGCQQHGLAVCLVGRTPRYWLMEERTQ